MKILLRDPITQRYLVKGGHWTPDVTKAKVFAVTEQALHHCVDKRLTHLELVLRLPQTKTNLPPRSKKSPITARGRRVTVRRKSFAQSV
jgi:hypothetical protein